MFPKYKTGPINGDEVRDSDHQAYRDKIGRWAEHMDRIITANAVPESMFDVLSQ